MIIVFGYYPLMRKLTAYRKDWCNTCDKECHAERYRTFRLGYLYWIPLVPMGFFRTWECAECGKDPRVRTRESVTTLVLGAVLCAVFLLAVCFVDPKPDERGTMWIIRLVLAVVFAGLVWLVRARLKEVPKERKITPYPTDTCYYCQGPLLALPNRGGQGNCETCKVDLAAQ